MNRPSVSICIVTYNSAPYIGECLKAVQAQTWPRCETIVIDNASSDRTVKEIEDSGVNVRLVANSANRGFAAAQNQAIGLMDSDYVLVLNPDVVLESNYVEVLVERMEQDRRIGSAAGCLVLESDRNLVDSAGLTFDWKRKAAERGAGDHVSLYGNAEEVFGVSGAAEMYARRMIDRISVEGQFFDEDFFAYKEDVDVAWRARLLGWKSWYDPEARGSHVRQWGKHTSRNKMRLSVRRHSYMNRYLMIIKNESVTVGWWLRLPALIGYEVALNGYLLLRDPAVFGCWREFVRLCSRAVRKRRLLRNLKLR